MALHIPHVAQILREAQKIQNLKRDKGIILEYLMYGVLWIMSKSTLKAILYNGESMFGPC